VRRRGDAALNGSRLPARWAETKELDAMGIERKAGFRLDLGRD
jgi:hypothetical protein